MGMMDVKTVEVTGHKFRELEDGIWDKKYYVRLNGGESQLMTEKETMALLRERDTILGRVSGEDNE